jgi:hypothetical protein
VLCPNCSAICRRSDGACYHCHERFPSGLRRQTVVAWSAGGCAFLAFLSVFLILNFKSLADVGAGLCVAVVLAFMASCFGALMGWILGSILCEH